MQGYWLNRTFNELRHPEARKRWHEDLESYLGAFALTESERQLILNSDWRGCIDGGTSVYTMTKLCATTGISLLELGAGFRGQTVSEFNEFLREQDAQLDKAMIPFTVKGK